MKVLQNRSRRRTAQLSDEQVEEVARKVLGLVQGPDDGTIMLLDEAPEGEAPKEEAPAEKAPDRESPSEETPNEDVHIREARIAFRLMALDFDTRKEYETYKKTHEIEQGTEIHIKEEEQKSTKKEDESSGKPSGTPEEKPEGDKSKKPDTKKDKPSADVQLRDTLEKSLGEDAANWNTHALHESQLSQNVNIRFPDGTTKKYKELSDEEKARVNTALKNNKVAHKGMNDYTKVDKDALAKNMANNLSRYDDESVQESKNDSTEPVTQENVGEFTKSMRKNAGSVLNKYAGAMSDISRPMAEQHVEHMAAAIEEGFKDGSLSGVSQADLDEFAQSELKRMIHQEVETRRRSLGDHGIRHLAANSDNTTKMLNELQAAGMNVTGKDKLMGLSIQANHDMGYTVGEPATTFGGSHKENSGELAGQEADRYAKIFGKDSVGKMKEIIRTHDDPDMDWDKEPLQSAVRLSDNISLFGKDKVQDLFIRSPRAMEYACKLRLAGEIEPPKPKEPKEKNFKSPAEYQKATEQYKMDTEEYQKPETQQKVKEARDLQTTVKKQLHAILDDEKFNDNDKELMHRQIDEMGEAGFSTSVDILSRYSGRIEGMKFDKGSRVMNINMKYSPEGQVTDSIFGDAVAHKQFGKFIDDLHGEAAKDEKGNPQKGVTNFKNKAGKPVFQLNIEGFDQEPEETATTEAMKAFISNTARSTLNKVRRDILPPPSMVVQDVGKAYKHMQASKDKFTDDEWGQVETLFKTHKNEPERISKALGRWPLLESERKYIEGKTASIARHLAASILKGMKENSMSTAKLRGLVLASMATMGVYRRLAQLSDEEKQEVIDKVKEKMNIKDEDVPGDEPSGDESGNETPESGDEAPAEDGDDEAESLVDRMKEKHDIQDDAEQEPEAEPDAEQEPEAEPDAEPESEDELDGDEDELDEDEVEPDDEDEEAKKDEIGEIVEGLVEEVETLKGEGHVSPGDVLGLIKSMMEMVNLLVEAKPPTRRRRNSKAVREFVIAERVTEMKSRR